MNPMTDITRKNGEGHRLTDGTAIQRPTPQSSTPKAGGAVTVADVSGGDALRRETEATGEYCTADSGRIDGGL